MDLSIEGLTSVASDFMWRFKHLRFGAKAQLEFLEDFYTLLNDGIPANRAVDMMAQVTSGITRDVAMTIGQKISEGQPLAEGMRDWFAPNVVEIIRIGEEGGALVETVKSAINTLGQRSSSISALVTAVSYPILVIITACAVIVYLNASVFIEFKAIKPMAEWPDAGRRLVGLAVLIQTWWWLFIVVLIAIFFAFRSLLNNYVGDLRPLLDNFFPFNLYRRFAASRLLETLGLLVSNGVVFKNAIKVMQYQASPYVTSHLVMMEHLLGMGRGNIADVLATGLINEADLMRLRVMAEVKGFEHGLVRMGVRGSEENTKVLKLIARIVGSALLIIGGYLVILIVQGIYLTAMTMGQA